MKRWFIYMILCASFLGCNTYQKPKDKKLIVCTTGYVADIVKNIVGPEAEILTLMGPGVDPHLYKASLKDVDYLSQADLIVYSGLHLEGKMSELLAKVGKTHPTICIADGLAKNDPITLDDKGTHDPHVWFDPILWSKGAIHFANEYAKLKWTYEIGPHYDGIQYARELERLDSNAKAEIAKIPENQRYLVTPHDAFGYFCRRYGLKVKSLQGISTLSEYGIRDVTNLISFLVEKKIPTVFVESSISPKAIEAIISGCKSKGHKVTIGGQLYSDALGAEGTPEADYKGVFLYNLRTISHGLQAKPTP